MTNVYVMEKIPEKIIIPLRQHEGCLCTPLVNKGDMVSMGQTIGDCDCYDSASIHSSVCGEIISIEEAANPNGTKVNSVIIKPAEDVECVDFTPVKDVSASKLVDVIKDAGIVEHYGTPTHKVLRPEGKQVDTVLINATSSEWVGGHYDTSSQYASQMIDALKLLMKAAGASKGAVVLRNDDLESISAFDHLRVDGKLLKVAPLIGKRKLSYYFKEMGSDIVVVSQERIYGQKILDLLTYNLTGRRVICSDPTDVGVAICGVKSAKALYDAVHEGRPYMETVVSVSGKVNSPKKVLVKIGTPFKDVIDACGGYKGEIGKIIANGAVTGVAQYTDDVPVTKMTTSITVLSADEVTRDVSIDCTHCARCVDVCPVNLIPSRITAFADQGRFDECRQMNILNCVECGRCSAVCPSKIHLLQLIRYAKNSIENAYGDLSEKQSSNLKLGCCGGGN